MAAGRAKLPRLSRRLAAVCELAGAGRPVVDVGCDHAFVPIVLVGDGRAPCAVASDLRPGPLSVARAHVDEAGLSGLIDVTLCDGVPADAAGRLAALRAPLAPAPALITAGMGGLLIRDIYARAKNLPIFGEFIASPQRDADVYRRYIREIGLVIVDERFIEEDGKYYPVIRSVRAGELENPGLPEQPNNTEDSSEPSEECRDLFGPVLLKKKDPVLREYLQKRETYLCRILTSLRETGGHEARAHELELELQLVREALGFICRKP